MRLALFVDPVATSNMSTAYTDIDTSWVLNCGEFVKLIYM